MPKKPTRVFVGRVVRAYTELVKALQSEGPHRNTAQSQADQPVIVVSGRPYSPRQILQEIKSGSDFGKKYIGLLYSLEIELRDKGRSIIETIRQDAEKARSQHVGIDMPELELTRAEGEPSLSLRH